MTKTAATPTTPRRRKRARRTRSPHPGVVLLKPAPGSRHNKWRARYRDPDTERPVKVTLDPQALPNDEARRLWAIDKSKSIARRKMELLSGAPRTTGATVQQGIDEYFRTHDHLRPRTLVGYKRAAGLFVTWCTKNGITTLDAINRAALVRFKDHLVGLRRRATVAGGKRGVSAPTAERRSPDSTNKDLRAMRTILGYCRDIDLLPRCAHDDMRVAMKRVPVAREQIHYLKSHELQKLLGSALRYDAACEPDGTTHSNLALAPFIAGLALTGMRLGEAHELQWSQVDLDALDDHGKPVGEIKLGAATKTHRGRTIDLAVSPALRQLLAALKLRSGGVGRVFGLSRSEAINGCRRLVAEWGAPADFTPQALRRTCASYLTNAGGIFAGASVWRSAKQLGHSPDVAEQSYLGIVKGIPHEARTLDAAMQIETELRQIVATASQPRTLTNHVVGLRRRYAQARAREQRPTRGRKATA